MATTQRVVLPPDSPLSFFFCLDFLSLCLENVGLQNKTQAYVSQDLHGIIETFKPFQLKEVAGWMVAFQTK